MGQQLIHQYPVPKRTDFPDDVQWALALEIWLERLQTDSDNATQVIQVGTYSVYETTSLATLTPDPSNYDEYHLTAQAADLTIANNSVGADDARKMIIRIKASGGDRSISYGSRYRGVIGTLPATATQDKVLYLGFIWNDTETKWDYVAYAEEA